MEVAGCLWSGCCCWILHLWVQTGLRKGTWWTPLACDWVRVYAQVPGEQCASRGLHPLLNRAVLKTSGSRLPDMEKQITLNLALSIQGVRARREFQPTFEKGLLGQFSFPLTPATHTYNPKIKILPWSPPSHRDYRSMLLTCPPEGEDGGRGGWHHRFNRHEHEQTPGRERGQGGLKCCSPRSLKESRRDLRTEHHQRHLCSPRPSSEWVTSLLVYPGYKPPIGCCPCVGHHWGVQVGSVHMPFAVQTLPFLQHHHPRANEWVYQASPKEPGNWRKDNERRRGRWGKGAPG